jgi:septal ring factor EnvC (AmiA/AmiB activator)
VCTIDALRKSLESCQSQVAVLNEREATLDQSINDLSTALQDAQERERRREGEHQNELRQLQDKLRVVTCENEQVCLNTTPDGTRCITAMTRLLLAA